MREEITAFAALLSQIGEVEELRAREIDHDFKTWVVVNNASEETRYAVYAAEWELMRRFPDSVFDFHLLDREGQDLESIITFGDGTLSITVGETLHAY